VQLSGKSWRNMNTHTLIHTIIDDVAPDLLAIDKGDFVQYARDLVNHNEQGAALGDLCQNLYEFDIAISPATRDKIHAAARTMRMDPDALPPIRLRDA
jgi:hypothetical protein